MRFFSFLIIPILLVAGCATYQAQVKDAKNKLQEGQAGLAAEMLEPKAKTENDDQLVYLLDYATALQMAGDYKKSAKAFAEADRISEVQDYHSLSRVTASLLLSEGMVQYKGDDFEKVLINTETALNYLMLGQLDEALVETRRVNNKLYKYKYEAKKNYEQNPFAFYLGAMIWEADRKWDDAYISYKKAYQLIPEFAPLKEDLIRSSLRAQRDDEHRSWREKFSDVKVRPEWRDAKSGELILILQQGWGPHKRPRPESPRFPALYPTPSTTKQAEVWVNGASKAKTETVYSVEKVAIQTLEDDFASLAARRVTGIVAKEVVADQVRQKDSLLGFATWLALHLSDRADLRQWSTLPETFQVARVWLKAGTYQVEARGLDASGQPSAEQMPPRKIEIKGQTKTFLMWRSVK